jgi:hypothetical protein
VIFAEARALGEWMDARLARPHNHAMAREPKSYLDDVEHLNDAEHWCGRAEEARLLSEQMTDPKARATMREIAVGYDTMAEHARVRVAKAKGSS